jgi:hypothetical protein
MNPAKKERGKDERKSGFVKNVSLEGLSLRDLKLPKTAQFIPRNINFLARLLPRKTKGGGAAEEPHDAINYLPVDP